MTTEEKAKAYDEAKARMSKAYNDNRCTIGFMNEIFPELKENEDEKNEKVRIGLIKAFNTVGKFKWGGLNVQDILAWLENQNKNNMCISEAVKQELNDSLDKALEKETPESLCEFLNERNDSTYNKEKLDVL